MEKKITIISVDTEKELKAKKKERGKRWCPYGVEVGISGNGSIGSIDLNFYNLFSVFIFSTFIFSINYLLCILIHEYV